MALLSVWAPRVKSLEACIAGEKYAMQKTPRGWWEIDTKALTNGTDYSLYLDGQGPLPDPRSPWQPEGIHGPSRWVDHQQYAWQDDNWQQVPMTSAVLYELHVGTFTPEGTYAALENKLDYLLELGVTHIELMPLAEFPGRHGWGYDGVDLYAPFHHYGSPDDLKHLIDTCHQKGIAVLLDVVYNHLGPDGNYLGQFAPYFTDRYATPWGEAVNLDCADSDIVRRFFIDNALMWMRDYHFDGLRLDAVHAFLDSSAVHFLEQITAEVKTLEIELGRPLILIAESDLNDHRLLRSPNVGGYGMDAQWNEDFHHALHVLMTGEQQGYYQDFGKASDLANVLDSGFTLAGKFSTYRQRVHGRKAVGISGRQLLGFIQNHDQVGNRARCDRINHIVPLETVKQGIAILLTSPFVPMLFQGEEWASSSPFVFFTDHHEELGKAVTKGRKREFKAFKWKPSDIPDPQAIESFDRSRLNWDELEEPSHNDMLSWYKTLLGLRKRHPELRNDDLSCVATRFDDAEGWILIERGRFRIAANFGQNDVTITDINGQLDEVILQSGNCAFEANTLQLGTSSIVIFTVISKAT